MERNINCSLLKVGDWVYYEKPERGGFFKVELVYNQETPLTPSWMGKYLGHWMRISERGIIRRALPKEPDFIKKET